MRRYRYNLASGSAITVQDVFDASARANASKEDGGSTSATGSGNSIWDSVKGEIGGWISGVSSGVASIVAAKNPAQQVDNTPKVLAIAGVGVAAVILVIVLLLVFKK